MATFVLPDYRIATTSISFSAGTGTVSSSADIVTGVSTIFTTQLSDGALIKVGATVYGIKHITDNTHLILQTIPANAFSGQSFTFHNLFMLYNVIPATPIPSVLSVPVIWPKSTPVLWPETLDTGDALARAMGKPMTIWSWAFLSEEMRDSLRTIIPIGSKSARVYVRTRMLDNADLYLTFLAAALWTDKEDRDATRRIQFTLEFRDMITI